MGFEEYDNVHGAYTFQALIIIVTNISDIITKSTKYYRTVGNREVVGRAIEEGGRPDRTIVSREVVGRAVDEGGRPAPELLPSVLSSSSCSYHCFLSTQAKGYLRYGTEAFRAEVLEVTDGSANPCILAGYEGSYTYSGVEYAVYPPKSGPSYDACREIVLEALKLKAPCSYHNCSFGGVWDGGRGSGQRTIYATSSFYYLPRDVGIVDPKSPNAIVRPVDLENLVKGACGKTFEDAKSSYPLLSEERVPFVCMDITYMYALLIDGLGLDPEQEFTLADKIEYEDALVETAWPLGTAIEAISSVPKFERFMYFICVEDRELKLEAGRCVEDGEAKLEACVYSVPEVFIQFHCLEEIELWDVRIQLRCSVRRKLYSIQVCLIRFQAFASPWVEVAEVKPTLFQPYTEVFRIQRFRECEVIYRRWAMLGAFSVLAVEALTGVAWQDTGKVLF
ncbi:hypothetical protein LR48_Vigan03g189200 [Vigna angularis]|uniref:Apyrase n=1 Tax=Phaseolus angularis TaxID=3914 RepID=A0A0L9U6T7_PHAAN|nr:hypothetical protein LR48_Vigan03g189200 [Vigna angularis]